MPTIRDNAVVIRRWDFSETSMTVSLFTREHGVIRGLAKGARREKGTFSGGLDLLTAGEVVAIVKHGHDLCTLTSWALLETFAHLRRSLAANRAAIYMCDLVHHMLRDHEPTPRVFDSMMQSLRGTESAERADGVLLEFQWMLLVECGFEPVLGRDSQTGQPLGLRGETLGFSARAGGVVADSGGRDRWRVRRSTIELLSQVASSARASEAAKGDASVIGRANRLLAAYIREILGHEPEALTWAFPEMRNDAGVAG